MSIGIIIGWTIGGTAVIAYKAWRGQEVSEPVHYLLGGYGISIAVWLAGA